jgi:sugar transferase (PEP-CTERM/EpsH1 system associated)
MAQYALSAPTDVKIIVDFVDVDAEKWKQYSRYHRWPKSWVFRRESEALLRFESDVAQKSDACVFVSREESELFCRLIPESVNKAQSIRNGVDTGYFSPSRAYENPYGPGDQVLVFTGAMDYWANVNAVHWFAGSVFREIQKKVPEAKFYIVGARPTREVLDLCRIPGVEVTGRVEDPRPYIAYSKAAVAPMRLARGVQNKVLEAMAMARPVLVTQAAIEGIEHAESLRHYVANEPEILVDRATELLEMDEEKATAIGVGLRKHVIENYDWETVMQAMRELVERGAPFHQRSDEALSAEALHG